MIKVFINNRLNKSKNNNNKIIIIAEEFGFLNEEERFFLLFSFLTVHIYIEYIICIFMYVVGLADTIFDFKLKIEIVKN